MKTFIKLLILSLCLSLTAFGFACKKDKNPTAESVKEKEPSVGLEYVLNEDGLSYTVVGLGVCEDADVVIPADYNDLPVAAIGRRAFDSENNLKSVVVGNNVTTIGEDAFACSENLTSIKIGDSVTTIADYAFCLCYSLAKIEVSPNNVAFKSINGNLYSKDGKKLIQYAIGKKDAKFVVPNGVEAIGYMAFYKCSNLTSVEISDSVITIGDRAFSFCGNLTSAKIGNGVITIGEEAFSSCESLVNLTVGNSVETIGVEAFYFCSSLEVLSLGDSVTIIGAKAFYWCYYLEVVELGEGISVIGDRAFESCSAIKNVYYKGTESTWAEISIGTFNEKLTKATRHYV